VLFALPFPPISVNRLFFFLLARYFYRLQMFPSVAKFHRQSFLSMLFDARSVFFPTPSCASYDGFNFSLQPFSFDLQGLAFSFFVLFMVGGFFLHSTPRHHLPVCSCHPLNLASLASFFFPPNRQGENVCSAFPSASFFLVLLP